jgi:two-component system NtrC family sensor kinase
MKSVISTVKCRDEDELFKTLSEELPVGVCIMQDGKFYYVNSTFPIAIGYTVDELLGKGSLEIVVPEDREMVKENTMKMLKGELRSPYQFRVTCKDGSIVWVMATVKPIQYHGKRATLGNYMEITERKLIEEAVKESEERYKELANSVTDVFFAVDENLRYTYWNKASEILTGVRMEDAIGKSIQEVFPDRPWRRKAEKMYRKVLETQQLQTFVNDYDIHGRHYILEINAYRSRGGVSVFVKDITDRKQAEEALRESEEKYRKMFEEALDAIFIGDADTGKLLDCNRAACELVGRERSELIGKHQRILHPPGETDGEFSRTFSEHLRAREGKVIETQVVTGKGEIKEVAIKANVLEFRGKKVIQGIFRDITERKHAEEALRQSEEKYRTILEEMEEGYYEVDLMGNFTFVNDAMCRILGYSRDELIGMNYKTYTHKENVKAVLDAYNRVYRTCEPLQWFPMAEVRKDGTRVLVEDSVLPITDDKGGVIGFRGISRDVTERKQAEDALQKSEERYRVLAENAGEAIFVVQDDVVKFINPKGVELSGYSGEELASRPFTKFIHPDDIHMVTDRYLRRLRGELVPQTYNFRIIRKDGDIRWGELNAVPVFWEDRPAVLCFMSDITERKQAEEALRQSEEKYRTILEETGDGYFETDLAGSFTFVNDAQARLLGYSSEEIIGMSFRAFTPEERVNAVLEAYSRMYKTGEPLRNFVDEVIGKDGSHGFAESSAFPIRNDRGKIVGFRGVRRDITARKQMEEALRHSEEKYRTILEEIEDAYFEVDLGGHLTFVNDSVCRDLGYSREELMGKSYKVFTVEDDIESVFRVFNEVYQTSVPNKGFPWKTTRKDGTHGFAETSISLLRNEHGETIGFRGVGRDITERKRAEEKLRQSEENYRALFDSSVIGTIVLDAETGKAVMANQAAAKIFEFSSPQEGFGQNPLDFVPPEDREMVLEAIRQDLFEQDVRRTAQFRAVTKSGREIWLSVTAARIMHDGKLAGLISFTDITEQKRQNERLMMTDRLASLGELASGTAHELNNPLTSIIGFSQLIMEREVPDDIREDLKLINTEAQRAANVTKNLLTFARKHAPVKQLSQINSIIEDVLKLRAYEHKANNIGVVKQLHPDLPEMMADYFQMQQVFMNIIINAEYFMTGAHKRGTLTITTKKQNGTVRISFADDGPGIPPENLKRIFDPFFTTKETGKGTGLGLSICHGIVTEHGGQIYARSQFGKGATILVELPVNGVQQYGGTR